MIVTGTAPDDGCTVYTMGILRQRAAWDARGEGMLQPPEIL